MTAGELIEKLKTVDPDWVQLYRKIITESFLLTQNLQENSNYEDQL